MKKIIFPLFVVLIASCQKQVDFGTQNSNDNQITTFENRNWATSGSGFVVGELVVYYEPGTTEAEKQALRVEHGVEEHKKCECADENLELWIFDVSNENDPTGFIETKKVTASAAERIEDADFNLLAKIDDGPIDAAVTTPGSHTDAMAVRVPSNSGVTVAILDTGIEYEYFNTPILYNNDEYGCVEGQFTDQYGWDFVNQTSNPYDNHPGKHGTANAHFVSSYLISQNVDFQILPVKVADRFGFVRYFDVLCGFRYAANNPDVDVINMSFGWYGDTPHLLDEFSGEVEDKILVVSSAGNNSSDNDALPHYPSSLSGNNVLAVTSTNAGGEGPIGMDEIAVSRFANYGSQSVDLAARGEDIEFSYQNEIYFLTGTSYAAAKGSAYASSLHEEGMAGYELSSLTANNCIYSQGLYSIKYQKFVPVE